MIIKQMSIYLTLCNFAFVTSDKELRRIVPKPKWMKEITASIANDSEIYQILLISEENQMFDHVFEELQSKLPVLFINSSFLTQTHEKHWKQFMSYPRNTLVTIVAPEGSFVGFEISRLLEFIGNSSGILTRPKCLIFVFLNANDHSLGYREFLDQMWKNLFLDLTILDVLGGNITVHQFNPFVSYTRRPLSREIELFPDKLKNLHRYPLRVGVFHQNPFFRLTRGKKESIQISGPDASVLKELARLMNFQLSFIESNVSRFGEFHCLKAKTSGLLRDLVYHRIHMIGDRSITTKAICSKNLIEGMEFETDHYVFVFPLFKKTSYEISIKSSFYLSIVVIVFCAGLSWTIEYFGKFDKTIWNKFVIIEILLGLGLEREPVKFREKCFFLVFLMVAFFWSSNIVASLTDIQFQLKEEIKMNTLDDLMKSKLLISCTINVAMVLKKIVHEEKLGEWWREERIVNYENCIDVLLSKQNVACVMKLSAADYETRGTQQMKRMKYLDHYLYSSFNAFLMEPGSPFIGRFASLYLELTRAGLIEKWQFSDGKIAKSQDHENGENEDDVANVKTTSFLLGIMIFGCSASFLAFIGELLLAKFRKRRSTTAWA